MMHDPTTGKWDDARNMMGPGVACTATLLLDGSVLSAGASPSLVAELYVPRE